MIKNFAKRVLRRLARLPGIGRYIRMAAALYRLAALAERGQSIQSTPLQSVVEAASGTDQDNLALSVPVSLRRMRRQLDQMEARLQRLEQERAERS
jgi:hypothetical protein